MSAGKMTAGKDAITPGAIDAGLRRNEFCLHYQPKLSLVSDEIAGSEALIRWFRPDGSAPPPADFIGIAERAGLMHRLSARTVALLMADIAVLSRSHFVPVAFNVSASDFEDDLLTRQILAGIRAAGVAPASFVVEITENEALTCDDTVRQNLLLLHSAGLSLSMDDYGIGYSTVDTLSKWPFSSIKVDQGLVERMLGSEKNAMIVRSAIRLGHELRIDVIAEGVETAEQCQFLLDAGCRLVQGYLVSRPLSLDQVVSGEHRFALHVRAALIHMAILDHLEWRRQLIAYALRRSTLPGAALQRQSDDHPQLSPCECSLGRWLHGDGQCFAERDEFRQLDLTHQTLHAIGADLVRRIRAGAGPLEVDACVRRVHAASMQMLDALSLLENLELAAGRIDNPARC